jgi:subtilisin family serine protease/PKD repeat protein
MSVELYDEQGRQQCYTDKVIVKLKDVADVQRDQENVEVAPRVKQIFTKAGVASVERLAKTHIKNKRSLDKFLILNLDSKSNFERSLEVLNNYKDIEYAEAMPIFYPDDVPNDASYNSLHHLNRIQAEEAWDIHKGEDGTEEIIVAIVDSGIDWKHEDLVNNIWNNLGEDLDNDGHTIEFIDGQWQFDPDDINGIDDDNNGFADDFVGWNFVNANDEQTNDLDDPSHHGTHCGGLAAGVTNNATGIASISWNVKLMGTGHDKDGGNAYESNCFDGIVYALDNGADVISCSWGTGQFSRSYEEVINELLGETVILASAGNSDWARPHYPSGYANIISVASTASNDEKAYYSCFGIATDISSPGGDTFVDGGLLSTIPGGYASFQGTSMASPFAAGLTALIRSQHPEWTRERVIQQLLATCDNIDEENPNYINALGAGRINALRALSEDNPAVDPKLRLALVRADNNDLVADGNTVDISLRIKNYACLTSTDNLTLELSCDNEGINVIDNTWTGAVPADWTLDLEDVFTFEVGNVIADSVRFTITSSADIEITYGQEMEFYLPVHNNNKVLIWEHRLNGTDMSGVVLRNFCEENGIAYDFGSEDDLPASFLGYKAIFMSWGKPAPYPYYDEHPNIDDYICPRIVDYLNAGGRVYIEGNSVMYNQSGQIWVNIDNNTAEMFGVTVEDGENFGGAITGQNGSIAEGLDFTNITQVNTESIDKYQTIGNAVNLLGSTEYGIIGVQNETDTYKTICSAFSINALGNNNGNRELYIKRIFEFFEVPFLAADFSSDYYSGHAPTEINFSNISSGFPTDYNIEWDFDNDGTIDSNELEPTFTYSETGSYDVRMVISNGAETKEVVKNNYVRVFDDFSAVSTNESYESIDLGSSFDLSGEYTVELWFKPTNWGEIPTAGFGQVFSWGSNGAILINEFMEHSRTISFWAYTGGGASRVYCNNDVINLYEWNHLAVKYSNSEGLVIIINGQQQTLDAPVPDALNSGNYNLVLGNNGSNNRTLKGSYDQVRVYDTALSNDIITSQMETSTAGETTNQVGYFHFNEGRGNTVENVASGEFVNAFENGAEWDFAVSFETTPNSNDDIEPLVSTLSNYPNPFNPETTISFNLREASHVTLNIFNIKGQLVRTLANSNLSAGNHSIVWNGTDTSGSRCSSGVYLYHLESDKHKQINKMLMLK